eukprot:scaffold73527_cov29-Prasinocladus_malaysianus.AAC.1
MSSIGTMVCPNHLVLEVDTSRKTQSRWNCAERSRLKMCASQSQESVRWQCGLRWIAQQQLFERHAPDVAVHHHLAVAS